MYFVASTTSCTRCGSFRRKFIFDQSPLINPCATWEQVRLRNASMYHHLCILIKTDLSWVLWIDLVGSMPFTMDYLKIILLLTILAVSGNSTRDGKFIVSPLLLWTIYFKGTNCLEKDMGDPPCLIQLCVSDYRNFWNNER